jgi:beta-glucosidase
VDNVGDRAGTEVVQLYVNDVVASVTRPVKELKGFARVPLEPGCGAIVRFELDLGQLGFYDRDMQFVVEPGDVRIMLGSSSEDVRVEETVSLEPVEGGEGGVRSLRPADVSPTAVEVRST